MKGDYPYLVMLYKHIKAPKHKTANRR